MAITQKSIILFTPQSSILDYIHPSDGIFKKNIFFIDLTKNTYNGEQYKQDAIIVAYTGPLQQTVFDYLMLQGTTLPPVIEGCNSVETCESAGKSFIHGSNASTPLQQFDVVSLNMQELHTMASRCLEQGDAKYLPQLVRYMQEHLDTTSELHQYHQQRQEQFMTIPDACEFFFNLLGIKYNAQQPETKTEHTILHPQVSKIKTTMFYSQVALEDTKQDSFIKNIDI